MGSTTFACLGIDFSVGGPFSAFLFRGLKLLRRSVGEGVLLMLALATARTSLSRSKPEGASVLILARLTPLPIEDLCFLYFGWVSLCVSFAIGSSKLSDFGLFPVRSFGLALFFLMALLLGRRAGSKVEFLTSCGAKVSGKSSAACICEFSV